MCDSVQPMAHIETRNPIPRWLILALSLGLAACGSDDSPEAPAPGDDLSSPADASGDTSGVPPDGTDTPTPPPDDGPPPIPTTGLRAFVISAETPLELNAGDMAGARIGDVVIANDHVRFVIRGVDEALYMAGVGPGAIVDAGAPEDDLIQELIPLAGLSGLTTEAEVIVTKDGSQGVAEVQASGPARPPALVDANVPGLALPDAHLTLTYRLGPEDRALEIVTALSEATQGAQIVADVLFVGGELDVRVRQKDGWLASSGPRVSYGLVADEPFDVLELGGITILLGPAVVSPIEHTQWLVVGDGSASSVVDEMIALRMTPHGRVTGSVTGGGEAVEVTAYDDEGGTASRFRPGADGGFSGLLPAGLYTLVAEGPGRAPGAPVSVDVIDGGELDGLEVSAEPAAALVVTLDMPIRLSVQPAGGGFDTVPLPPGENVVPLAPGDYTVVASRGFEYEMDQTTITLEPGGEAAWAPTLVRSVDTTGWIASDFHLHSEWSADSNVPLRQRVVACAAEGIEYAVATDHDVITDYGPYVLPAVKPFIAIGIGAEVSTAKFGHINTWPLKTNPALSGRGAPKWHGLEFPELMELLNPLPEQRVVQINHGRSDDSGLFTALGFDPEDPDPALLAMFTFNAMEIFNGGGSGFDELLLDWMVMLSHDLPIAATGVSDAHSIGALCGHARTMVEVADDDPVTLATGLANLAVRSGRTIVTSGPFLTAEPGGAPGTVHVRVQAPSWMPVEKLVLYADGVEDVVLDIPSYETTQDVVRFDEDVTLVNAAAGWALAVVSASAVPGPMLKRKIRAVSPVVHLD